MSSHAGHDMSSHAGHDMSSHAGHDMSGDNLQQDQLSLHSASGHGGDASHFVLTGGHGDGVLQAGVQEVLLFRGAVTSSAGTLFAACVVMIILAVTLEYLRLLAWWLESRRVRCAGGRRDDGDGITTCNGKTDTEKAGGTLTTRELLRTECSGYDSINRLDSAATPSTARLTTPINTNSVLCMVALGVLHVLTYVLATCLMLITMTFNIYLIVSLGVGSSIGKLATMHTRTKLTPVKS